MNTMEITEGQDDLIRTWYQDMPKNPDEYSIMLRFSTIVSQFCNDRSNDVDFNKYLSDLRRESTVDLFFNKGSIVYSNLFRVPYQVLKHYGFDRPLHPLPDSR